jgi:hypothetical protein
MKRIIMVLFTLALISHVVSAQKMDAGKVPAAVTSAFKVKFPGAAKTTWEMEKANEYEAGFMLNGEEVSANFDKTGKLLETETEIKITALPAAVQSSISNNFAGFKIKEASRIESTIHGKCFEAEIKKGKESFDVMFTVDGKMLNKTKKEEKD